MKRNIYVIDGTWIDAVCIETVVSLVLVLSNVWRSSTVICLF